MSGLFAGLGIIAARISTATAKEEFGSNEMHVPTVVVPYVRAKM